MLSIVIADDEVGIVDMCKILIDYPEAKIVGEAHDGLELLEKIEKLRPNTVITDICMPGMTGLELIEKVTGEYPDINFIVMSGYAEFSYAQQALSLGVKEYFLKPLQKAEINRVLENLDDAVKKKQRENQHHEEIADNLKKTQTMLKEEYIGKIWDNLEFYLKNENDTEEDIDFIGNKFQCFILEIDNRFDTFVQDEKILIQRTENLWPGVKDLLTDQHCVFVVRGVDGIWIAVYEEEEAEERSAAITKKIEEFLRNYNNRNDFMRAYCAKSSILEGGNKQIAEAFRQAKEALKWRFEQLENRIISYKKGTEEIVTILSLPSAITDIKDAASAGDKEKIKNIISDVYRYLKKERKICGRKYQVTERLVEVFNQGLEDKPMTNEDTAAFRVTLFDVISGCTTVDEIERRFIEQANNAIDKYNEYFDQKERGIIQRAKQYITKNFAREITLTSVAEYIGLSSAYFSTVFKNEAGEGFTKYLQKVRVEEAKKLLKNTKMKISDIVEAVGYHDIKSFNKIFFAETQVKPSEYRKFYS